MEVILSTQVYVAVSCPKCYTRISIEWIEETGNELTISEEWEPVCPHCGTKVDLPIEIIVNNSIEFE